MQVKFTVKDSKLPEEIYQKMEKKLHKRLDSYYRTDRPLAEETQTILVKVMENKRVYKVEINMPYAGQMLRTENEERDNALSALDKGIDILERQVKKHKTRMARNLRDSIKPGDMPAPVYEDEPETDADAEEDFRVVKIKSYESKPMSVQDAVLQMELLGHNFYTFYNAQNNKVSTVYRRNDGDYGLIELL